MEPSVGHLHTYFLFPFSIDREEVLSRHAGVWNNRSWIDGLDEWIARHDAGSAVSSTLGPWRRTSLSRFDADSRAYQDMVFFHPFVRRIYFDTGATSQGEQESLLRRYGIPLPPDSRVRLEAEDARGRSASVDVTDLTLFLFANGIGILSIGIEANGITAQRALWINEMMRKIYPSSGRQRREGRVPSRSRLLLEHDGKVSVVTEETFQACHLRAFQPPISRVLRDLLYFAGYAEQEYEPVLDERMIVYSYLAVDPRSVHGSWRQSEEYEHLLSRALYVDQGTQGFRYDPGFTRELMNRHVYRRWAHEGTYYGFTSYSNITMVMGESDRADHLLREGFVIHRMFDSRYYLMMIVALFYRATLLDFAERVALVSRRLYRDFENRRLSPETLEMTDSLRSEFLNFANYWHFEELANKDEESEHFSMQNAAFRIGPMMGETEREIDRMHQVLSEYYQSRSTQAVNRLAMLSMILGAGAVLTGFFGMNFGRAFGNIFFDPPDDRKWIHYAAILGVSAFSLGAVTFVVFLVLANWSDYRDVLIPRKRGAPLESLRRVSEAETVELD